LYYNIKIKNARKNKMQNQSKLKKCLKTKKKDVEGKYFFLKKTCLKKLYLFLVSINRPKQQINKKYHMMAGDM
jgi:hypothetical protein